MRVSTIVILALFSGTLVQPVSAEDSTSLSSRSGPSQTPYTSLEIALKHYKAGNYHAARKCVEPILRVDSRNVSARYLLANCLLAMNELPEASHEYAIVIHLDPKSQLADNARKAIKQIEAAQMRKTASENRSAAEAVSDESDGLETGESFETETNRSESRSSPKHLPPGTLELIRAQTAKARRRAIETGQEEAAGELSKAESQGRAERERVERLVNNSGSRGDQQALSGAELSNLRSRAAQNAESLRQLGEAKAAWKEREAHEKSEGLQRQAEELEEQLVNNDRDYKGRTVKLNPVGTNLYIRNYSSAKPPVKSLDARARILPAITDEMSTSASTSATQAKRGKDRSRPTAFGSGISRTETKIEGEVLPLRH